jgi:predicted nucleic acid-binding protein
MKNYLLDANVILRLFLGDHAQQLSEVVAFIDSAEAASLVLDSSVINEVIHILLSVKYAREGVSVLLSEVLSREVFAQDDVLRRAIKRFGSSKLDFVDCLLLERAISERAELFTFDKLLIKELGKSR